MPQFQPASMELTKKMLLITSTQNARSRQRTPSVNQLARKSSLRRMPKRLEKRLLRLSEALKVNNSLST